MESTLVPPAPEGKHTIEEEVSEIAEVYPWARHLLLMVLVILALTVILSLIYLNGKTIYEYGL